MEYIQQFWMVYVEGTGGPTKKHISNDDAQNEAIRLCRQTGKAVYILRVTGGYFHNDIKYLPAE